MVEELSCETMPIILEEAFAYYDKERLKNILKYIKEQYGEHQILIFTCTKREQEAIEELKTEYNYVDLENKNKHT